MVTENYDFEIQLLLKTDEPFSYRLVGDLNNTRVNGISLYSEKYKGEGDGNVAVVLSTYEHRSVNDAKKLAEVINSYGKRVEIVGSHVRNPLDEIKDMIKEIQSSM